MYMLVCRNLKSPCFSVYKPNDDVRLVVTCGCLRMGWHAETAAVVIFISSFMAKNLTIALLFMVISNTISA